MFIGIHAMILYRGRKDLNRIVSTIFKHTPCPFQGGLKAVLVLKQLYVYRQCAARDSFLKINSSSDPRRRDAENSFQDDSREKKKQIQECFCCFGVSRWKLFLLFYSTESKVLTGFWSQEKP